MAIADTINSMKTNITNAYNAIQTKGGTVPTNKNLANLSTAINSISTGGGIEDVATVAALKAKCTAENAGKVYRYTGTTSGNYIKGALYVVHYDDTTVGYGGISYSLFDLGLEIYKLQTAPYTITYNLTDCSITSGDSTNTMDLCGSKKIIITATADYTMPESITVTGCSYNYTLINNNYNAILELYNPTGNITVTIIATAAGPDYGKTPTYQGLWNLFGDNNFRGAKNSTNVFDNPLFMSDFISNYSKISGGATSYWTQFIKDLSAAGDMVKSSSKGLTDKDFDNIRQMIKKAFYGVSLTVNVATSSASEFMKSGYMEMKVEFEKNGYILYMWLKTEPYAPLD